MSEKSKVSALSAGKVLTLCSDFILKKDEKPHVNMLVKNPWKWEHAIHFLLMLWFSQNVKAVKWGGESGAWVSIQSGLQSLFDYFFFLSFTFPSRKLRVQSKGCLSTSLHQQITVPFLALITYVAEQISPCFPEIYWQPFSSGHKIWFLGVERDLLSRAACSKEMQVSSFSYPEASSQQRALCGFLPGVFDVE